MITVTLLPGKDTVSIYKKTGIIPPEENTAGSGGHVITRQFGTEVEYRAYAMAVEDLEGHRDRQMPAPVTSPAPSFRTGDFVRLTDEAVGSIRRSFGDYRKEMLLEVIYLRPSSENPTVGVRDIHEDDVQEFNAVSLRPLTAEDLLGIFSTV